MLTSDNRKIAPALPLDPSDLTIGDLLDALAGHKDKPLVFHYDGRPVKPGYHVTEVKAGQFSALDCGANPEAWTEIFVQLWDVDEGGPVHMPAGKFAAIIRKVADHVALDPSAKLTFEVSDGVRPMELHKASRPSLVGGAVEVELSPRPASCKPRDRWLEEQRLAGAPCCSPAGGKACCS
ncbi:DUF6428 family protein [Mesorhizobium sp. ORS 3428]|uniref:DUF6428 family protein n=1 Tax=Mesorhizobium sp. ORS 3428 TaxID=540997 RepID=UPI0008D90BA1|nr:DUF6428 family protein [Mesorhizobium sp. ORS 3428]OHV88695.1 hypothetical protein ORS3428_17840 [Mesorhizobium sp. ORS 3428]